MARLRAAQSRASSTQEQQTPHLPNWARLGAIVPAGAVLLVAASACTSGGQRASSQESSSGSSSASTAVVSTPSAKVPTKPTKPTTKSAGPSVAKTTVAQPSRGSVKSTVPSRPVPSAPKVPLSGVADFGDEVTSRLASVRAINASAHIPGEVAGPAVSVTVEITNGSGKSIDLGTVTVNVYTSTATPGVPLTQNGSSLFAGSLAAGKSARGTYVFSLPTTHRNPITVTIRYSADAPLVTFVGTAK